MSGADTRSEISSLSAQIFELTTRLHELQKGNSGSRVPNYPFETQLGRTTLLDLFAGQDTLMLIHNMGQGCRWCTVWVGSRESVEFVIEYDHSSSSKGSSISAPMKVTSEFNET